MHFITYGHTIVAHTYAAWLWFPHVIVLVDKAVDSAILVTNWFNFRGVGVNGVQEGGLFKEKQKQEGETQALALSLVRNRQKTTATARTLHSQKESPQIQ